MLISLKLAILVLQNKSMKFLIATKIVKTKEQGTATLTRTGNRVCIVRDSHVIRDMDFATVRAAKHFMGSTTTI